MSVSIRHHRVIWTPVRRLILLLIGRSAHRVLAERTLHMANGRRIRWLRPEIVSYVGAVGEDVKALRPISRTLYELSFGNRLMVELAMYTIAGYRQLLGLGVDPINAKEVMADIGWHVYRLLLGLASAPAKLIWRDPRRRLLATIRVLARFPFTPQEPHGYAVHIRQEGDRLFTHWTRCPPLEFVRAAVEHEQDPDLLDAFYESWCLYDWPGADVVAGDGKSGHYRRSQTLSCGDPVCDMCWIGEGSRRRSNDRLDRQDEQIEC